MNGKVGMEKRQMSVNSRRWLEVTRMENILYEGMQKRQCVGQVAFEHKHCQIYHFMPNWFYGMFQET